MEEASKPRLVFVIIYLQNPREKYWGVLHDSTPAGVWLSGTGLRNLEEWLNFGFRQGDPAPAFTTTFFPMHRVEKITVDETEGGIPSLKATILERTGTEPESFFTRSGMVTH